MTPFLTIFQRFPTKFPKIFQNCSEGQTNVCEHFLNIFKHFPKISEDCQRWPKKIRRCFDHTSTNKCSWRPDKREMLSNMISSHARISYRFWSICYHLVYHWLLYNKMILTLCICPPLQSLTLSSFQITKYIS